MPHSPPASAPRPPGLGVALAVACVPSLAAADDDAAPNAGQPDNPFYTLDTKNLFGFFEGADVGEKGDRSVELETTGSFGKPQGLYDSIEQEFIFENTLTDSLGLELGAHLLAQDVPTRVRPARFRRCQFHGPLGGVPLRADPSNS
ncbi:MAG TPA: hypothetical protein VJY34_28435 [Roseiarcus sp.]|nr:hypothetical protein [Roseiarcus sp.]